MTNLKEHLGDLNIDTTYLGRALADTGVRFKDYTTTDFQTLFEQLFGVLLTFETRTTAMLVFKYVLQHAFSVDFSITNASPIITDARSRVAALKSSGRYDFLWTMDEPTQTTSAKQSSQSRSTNSEQATHAKISPPQAVRELLQRVVIDGGYVVTYDEFIPMMHNELRDISSKLGRMTAFRAVVKEDPVIQQWVNTTSKWHLRANRE